MFTSKTLFSDIACPYQQKCMLPGCIFGHREDQVKGGHITIASKGHALESGDASEQQTISNGHQLLEHQEVQKISSSTSTPSVKAIIERPKQRKFITDEAISPPPLRRKVLDGTAIPVKHSLMQNGTLKAAAKTGSAPSTPEPARKAPVKVTLKKETLNPRALKGPAPAKHDMRFKLIHALHEHFVRLNSELAKDANDAEEKLVLSDQELITKALDIEEAATFQPPIYSNLVKNQILTYKKMSVGDWKSERQKDVSQAKAAEAALLSDTPARKPTEPPKPIDTGLGPNEELKILPRLYTPIAGLSKHGYVITIPTEQDIEAAKIGVEAAKGWEVCDRCKGRFQVFPDRREEDGALASGGPCTYHYGKPYWQDRSALDPKAKREKKYRCCSQSMGDSPGCTQAESHVFKISEVKRMAAVLNFEKTPENLGKTSSRPVCIDGEMGYTVYGLELIRLTATSWPNGEELFDVLVRPIGPILDLNSRYSGVWPKDMAEAIPWDSTPEIKPSTTEPGTKRKLRIVESPGAARALLFSNLSPQTPLIGHGLENDLNATRIIHPTIIDTALLYPHKAGLPYRNGLKMLMLTHLNRHIQVIVDGKMEGHDSKEDANAAGDLVRLALANEWQKMKRNGWILKDGDFKPPLSKEPPPGASIGPSGRKRSRNEIEEAEQGEEDG